MSLVFKTLTGCAILLAGAIAAPTGDATLRRRQDLLGLDLKVDLDYAVYKGYNNATSGLNIWKGIRYAAAPIGDLRWKAPRTPPTNKTTQSATNFGPTCPQVYPAVPNVPNVPGDEDCLFLNVYAPANTSKLGKLPVLVWIHGGGYGYGDGTQDMSSIISANKRGFLGVTIQYRLGAFGFLSSSEVKAKGVVNAGLLDQAFALAWVQSYISKFGGDPKKVTISGESAGGGSVMYHAMAKGGTLGTTLWQNGIAASPYLVAQYDFNATVPTQRFYAFSSAAGCGSSGAVLDCIKAKDSATLQQANWNVGAAQTYGTWAFLPVTDYSYIQQLPSVQLKVKKVNGENMLVGNNANEGALFVPPTISTLADLTAWLKVEFPNLSDEDIQAILDANPASAAVVDPAAPKFATNGLTPPPVTAVNVSQVATGQQQRGDISSWILTTYFSIPLTFLQNIYAESTFVCPSYWLNSAYDPKSSYHYQYSVPFAGHTDDISAYFGPSAPNQSPAFSLAFRQIWGNMVMKSNPSIASEAAASNWPVWTGDEKSRMLNLNETGGTPYTTVTQFGATVTQFMDPGLQNAISVANAWAWEGGRGKRCEFWRGIAGKVPI
ncbi:alpha/beta-hydrolase [Lindgomyces ingoldianus]|uniref:Alpha/beta-hydrolase n=1 Tax=Lindgomyces ingoldianus TaxID=673940 RepID=A0ACB6QYP4_9PLEO|nr:alpha/beta-hydrolase [Lindgomyces ingoldianus]KAF2471200.1 alpha/beta-hydrolase [Lindgomyces ingoldianus]